MTQSNKSNKSNKSYKVTKLQSRQKLHCYIGKLVDLSSILLDLEDSFVEYVLPFGDTKFDGKRMFHVGEFNDWEIQWMDAILALKEILKASTEAET